MNKLNLKEGFLIGVTLFAMFFGAGNLIFAPIMGVQAGTNAIWALIGFILTAVICPILAVLILSRYKNAFQMLSRLHPVFAFFFLAVIYLMLGPGIAIPRTATVSFEMMTWFLGDSFGSRVLYSVIFFGLAGFCAKNPAAIKNVIGRFLTPILIVMVLIVCLTNLFGDSNFAPTTPAYQSGALMAGMNDGYQTMDILATYCFGPVLVVALSSLPKREGRSHFKIMVISSITAGALLTLLYSLLCMVGARHGAELQHMTNGAQIVLWLAQRTWEQGGSIICSIIFFIACFNVCTNLLCNCSAFFGEHFKILNQSQWLIVFTIASLAISLFGLDVILKVSAPMLNILSPFTMIFLVIGLVHLYRDKKRRNNGVQGDLELDFE